MFVVSDCKIAKLCIEYNNPAQGDGDAGPDHAVVVDFRGSEGLGRS